MLSRTKGFSDKLDVGVDLEREMSELMALRRAVCLLIASGSRPKRFGRSDARAAVRRAFYSVNRAQPGVIYPSGKLIR
jgi:hypothetical protein